MLKLIGYIFIFLLVLPSLNAQEDTKKEILKIIKYDTDLDYKSFAGYQIAIIDKDTNFVYEIGKIDLSNSNIFELGSIMKSMTASLVHILADKSYFNLSDPVNNYLPSSYTNPRLDHIRIIDLLEHTSGFPKRPNDFGTKETQIQNPYAHYTKLDLLKFYNYYLPKKGSYGKYLYAHTNYALLEVIIENATQETFEYILKKEIFDPLKMGNSYVSLSEHVQENMVDAYDRSEKKVYPWTFNSFAASNGLKSTMEDLIKFINANLETNQFDITHESKNLSNLNKNIFGAHGWHVLKNEAKFDIITLSGKTSGHHCMIAFIKDTKTGVIIMSNNAVGSKNLAFLILRMINNNWSKDAIEKIN